MRQRPQIKPLPRSTRARDVSSPKQVAPPQTPQSQGDLLQPFLQSGGQPFILQNFSAGSAETAGVQLLCEQFIPRGFTGWIKRLAVAPFMPPALYDPWAGWPANYEYFLPLVPQGLGASRGSARAGLWSTPFGWESYVSEGTEIVPSWRWQLTIWPGDLKSQRARKGIPPFSVTDPASWLYVPNVAVPASTYPGGIPGKSLPGVLGPQRAQILPGDGFVTHIMVPENSTLLLWAWWQQSSVSLRTASPNGPDLLGTSFMPLGASFGMVHGYMQATDRAASNQNARFGWGG